MEDKHSEGLLECLAFIGSSTTAGYGVGVRLAHAFERLFNEPYYERHKRQWFDCAMIQLRLAPERLGERMIERTNEHRPTLVVAVDFLFWFVYGPQPDRLALLERGLALLEQFTCPVAVGNIPTMAAAAIEGLPMELRPSADELARANERIKIWVSAQPSRVLVLWAETAAQHPTLRQPDGLHANVYGLDALARALARSLVSRNLVRREFFADRIITD